MVTSILGSAVGSVEPMIDAALRVMDYKCIKSLGAEARWGANFTTRNVRDICESLRVESSFGTDSEVIHHSDKDGKAYE